MGIEGVEKLYGSGGVKGPRRLPYREKSLKKVRVGFYGSMYQSKGFALLTNRRIIEWVYSERAYIGNNPFYNKSAIRPLHSLMDAMENFREFGHCGPNTSKIKEQFKKTWGKILDEKIEYISKKKKLFRDLAFVIRVPGISTGELVTIHVDPYSIEKLKYWNGSELPTNILDFS